jgi:hypothetical protein
MRIDETYRGQHRWLADDFTGIWFNDLGHGDLTSWSLLALLVAARDWNFDSFGP